jgi:SAM-dependent methyltransferase
VPSSHGNRQKHESKNPIQRALIGNFHAQLAQQVSALAPSEVLEVGCGEGFVFKALREHGVGCPLTGIDLSEDAIAEARQRVPSATFAVQDALELARAGRTFDVVLMLEVLEHIPEPERMLPVLASIARRALIVSVPWEPFFRGLNLMRGKHVTALGNDPEHINHWGRASFKRFMGQRFRVREAPLVFPWTMLTVEHAP